MANTIENRQNEVMSGKGGKGSPLNRGSDARGSPLQKQTQKKHKGNKCGRGFLWVALAPVVLWLLFVLLDGQISKAFLFEPTVLHTIAKKAIGSGNKTMEAIIETIATDLSRAYPGHVNLRQEWLFNNAGGAMGHLYLLHCSLTEYVIIFGTPIGTEGHTGRFFARDYFMILKGEQWAYAEGQLEKEVYKPGDLHILERGNAQGYRCPDACYALEYARGWIPLMMPFGIADTFSSTLDFPTFGRTLWWYIQLVIAELVQGKI